VLTCFSSLRIAGWQVFPDTVKGLIALNIGLQVFDGLASYKGFRMVLPEGNPLVIFLTEKWGIEWALLAL
jgi:hypothetical protein